MGRILQIVCGIVLALGLIYGQSSAQGRNDERPRQGNEQRTTPVNDYTPQLERISGALEKVADDPDAAHERQTADKDLRAQQDMAKWALWMVIGTGLQVIVGAAGVIVVLRTLEQGKAALRQGQDAIKAANDSNAQARKAMQVELRAYVALSNNNLGKILSKDGSVVRCFDFGITWENTGATPARKVATAMELVVLEGPIPTDHAYILPNADEDAASLGPKQTLVTHNLRVTPDFARGKRVYICGSIEYNDVFAGTRRRRSEVCNEVVFDRDPGDPQVTVNIQTSGPFNGFDGDCHIKPARKA